MTSTPDANAPENDDLDQLESESEDELLTPEEDLFQEISDPQPTDAIGGGEGPADPK